MIARMLFILLENFVNISHRDGGGGGGDWVNYQNLCSRHGQRFRCHLAPFKNRFQIAPVSVKFSDNFDPVPCERKGVLRLVGDVFNYLQRHQGLKTPPKYLNYNAIVNALSFVERNWTKSLSCLCPGSRQGAVELSSNILLVQY